MVLDPSVPILGTETKRTVRSVEATNPTYMSIPPSTSIFCKTLSRVSEKKSTNQVGLILTASMPFDVPGERVPSEPLRIRPIRDRVHVHRPTDYQRLERQAQQTVCWQSARTWIGNHGAGGDRQDAAGPALHRRARTGIQHNLVDRRSDGRDDPVELDRMLSSAQLAGRGGD